ncbi:hypothetical protein [Streptomyces sp. RTd22]|uniref:hypothetical protein n=1 Tax=Streptomyces sp. RTd22 TaxID=1841249 RepID=UPI0007C58769|nr:hypothetical protein [Streptomyces sp. RTd22]
MPRTCFKVSPLPLLAVLVAAPRQVQAVSAERGQDGREVTVVSAQVLLRQCLRDVPRQYRGVGGRAER